MNRLWLLMLAPLLAAGGCSLAPDYQQPQAPIPDAFPSGPAYPATAPATAPAATELHWRDFFPDPRLQKLLAAAIAQNLDLRLASLNVQRARDMYGIQRSALFPTLNATASASRQRVPGDLSGSGNSLVSEQYGVNLGVAAWEIDFFGRIRSLEQNALEQYFATEQARRGAQILLVSSVASAYLNLAADREILQLTQDTLQTQQSALELVTRRFKLGLVPELDVHRAQAQVETARRDVFALTQQVARDQNALNLLAGAIVPGDLLPENLAQVNPLPDLSPGTPSELLLSRPDILQAEYQLKAAYANIGAARAAFFPRISLTAAVGTASRELTGLFGYGSGVWSYAPQIVMPIFDARTWAAVRVSRTEQEIAVAQYQKTIQAGFREVADALAIRGTVDQQLAAQQALVQAASETYRLSNVRYEKGLDSYLNVLDAQRSLYAAQQQLVLLRLAKLANQVRLFAVLGGGWQSPATQPAEDAAAASTAAAKPETASP